MAKDGAMPQDPHAEKRLAKLKALLDYLIDPTKRKEDVYCISCDQLANAMKDYSPHRAYADVETKNSLRNKEANPWLELFNETSKFDSLKELYQQAVKKYGFSIEGVGTQDVSIQRIP